MIYNYFDGHMFRELNEERNCSIYYAEQVYRLNVTAFQQVSTTCMTIYPQFSPICIVFRICCITDKNWQRIERDN